MATRKKPKRGRGLTAASLSSTTERSTHMSSKPNETKKQRIERHARERTTRQFGKDPHDFGASAYTAALKYFAEHHRNPRALERFMRRLEA